MFTDFTKDIVSITNATEEVGAENSYFAMGVDFVSLSQTEHNRDNLSLHDVESLSREDSKTEGALGWNYLDFLHSHTW